MTSKRCTMNVFDRETGRQRKCLLKKTGNSCFCSVHCRKCVIRIQAAWVGFKCRTKIKIFKNLPSDLWNIILKRIRIEHYRKNLVKKYYNIYNCKLEKILSKLRAPIDVESSILIREYRFRLQELEENIERLQ